LAAPPFAITAQARLAWHFRDYDAFCFFSSRRSNPKKPGRSEFELQGIDAERKALTVALHSLLESLPQSYSGRENIKLLCNTILSATPHLRFIWVGFREGKPDSVAQYASVGDCAQECDEWNLPGSCFDCVGPYSQAVPAQSGSSAALGHLFKPWRENPAVCSVTSALAIPLRSVKPGLQGMIVFYADSADYFSHMGLPLFQAFCHVAEIIWTQSSLTRMLTRQDPLTGLMNRRETMHVLEKGIARAEKNGEPLSIMICRIDSLNKLNELYGWKASDAILTAFSAQAIPQMRAQDNAGRWSDAEFLYIMPRTNDAEAALLAGNFHRHFQIHPINIHNLSIRLTVHVGIATYSQTVMGLDDLISDAIHNMAALREGLFPAAW
jgi:diguanylate cyclase (GGDEF)-like protein